MLVTELGIVTLRKESQKANAPFPMHFTVLGMVKSTVFPGTTNSVSPDLLYKTPSFDEYRLLLGEASISERLGHRLNVSESKLATDSDMNML